MNLHQLAKLDAVTSHSPQSLRELALAKQSARCSCVDGQPLCDGCAAIIKCNAACTPALLLALIERLDLCRQNLAALGDRTHSAYMTTPLSAPTQHE